MIYLVCSHMLTATTEQRNKGCKVTKITFTVIISLNIALLKINDPYLVVQEGTGQLKIIY